MINSFSVSRATWACQDVTAKILLHFTWLPRTIRTIVENVAATEIYSNEIIKSTWNNKQDGTILLRRNNWASMGNKMECKENGPKTERKEKKSKT